MKFKVFALGAIFVTTLPVSGFSADLPASSDAVAVEINGAKISLADMEQKRPAAMFQARSNYYEAARRTLEEFVDQYLLEQQAKKENLTVPQLLEKHVNSTIAKDPSEETLRVYFEGADTTESYEAVKAKIIDALRERRIGKAKAAYMDSLRSHATVMYRLAPPRAPLSTQSTPPRGPQNARVTLTEYADYECPYCQQMQPALNKLEAEFKDRLAFVYKDYPLPMHANAQKAAEASRCADAQGKYWEYHDLLSTSKQLDIPSLKTGARKLNLDGAAFDKCLDSGEKADGVKAHAAEAQALGIQGTPTFFINGRYISGSLSYERLRDFILEELGTPQAQPTAASRSAVAPK